jgi:DNA (cytosine-5)-methyltransferase 1
VLTVLDLFSGIGGFSLGLESTGGFRTVAFCENAAYPRTVLARRWPGVPIHDDVRTFRPSCADVVCGGFPCQDLSFAGRGAGLAGTRSGLWWEFRRVIQESAPRWVIIENVPALRSRGLDRVLRSLAEIGYDAEWHCIPASAVGAPHQRDRLWIVAYPMAYAHEPRLERRLREILCERAGERITGESGVRPVPDPDRESEHAVSVNAEMGGAQGIPGFEGWEPEPGICPVADGVPGRVARLTALGNAVVPQVVRVLGLAILDYERNVP